MTWLVVGVGGALGAMSRHALNGWVLRLNLIPGFPAGIFLVNVVGSAAIGLLAGLIASGRLQVSPDVRTFLMVGILGGFTTFSSFSLDTIALLRTGQPGMAALNVFGQLALSLAAAAIGYRLGS
ncbi:MAG: fluoride efflux transporter CrcB [Acidobacteria bacterium]|nr:fluoride efflux transporter CrcB [Acidobacteriota bacterium]